MVDVTDDRLDLAPYDAVLLVSFGGPEQPADVVPFLENVTRGRGIPRERLAEVGQHYYLFGGRSPINDQCRRLLAALETELAARGSSIPLFWGNRNWDPYLADAMRDIAAAGHRRVLAVVTSAYPSYSSCRQYRENLYDAVQGTELVIDRIRHYADTPGFVIAFVEATEQALHALDGQHQPPHLVFVTHSIPAPMAETAGPPPRGAAGSYVEWHQAVAAEITRQIDERRGRHHDFDLVYCSRSGPAGQPWLEPDVNDRLTELHEAGCESVVIVPIGFVSDHMEVIFDLDTEAAATAAKLGLRFARAATAGDHPAFVGGLVDLLAERASAARGGKPAKPVVDGGVVGWYECQPGCCPNLREPGRPTLLQAQPA